MNQLNEALPIFATGFLSVVLMVGGPLMVLYVVWRLLYRLPWALRTYVAYLRRERAWRRLRRVWKV